MHEVCVQEDQRSTSLTHVVMMTALPQWARTSSLVMLLFGPLFLKLSLQSTVLVSEHALHMKAHSSTGGQASLEQHGGLQCCST